MRSPEPLEPTTPVPLVRLELLNAFQLYVDGIRVDPQANTQRLLAFLALRGPVARVVAAGTLWNGVLDEQAMASLRTTIWRCNQLARGLITADRYQLGLAAFVNIDTDELINETAFDLAEHSADQSLPDIGIFRSELLPGWYDDWVTFERERIRLLRLHTLECTARSLTARGHYLKSLQYGLEAVRCEPLRESARRAVILTHLAENNTIEAVREYERFRRLLVDQLGVEPSKQLSDLVFQRNNSDQLSTGL